MTEFNDDRPCFAFGVITDVQYADADDGYDYSGRYRRYYRNALQMLQQAVNFWMKRTRCETKFVLQLGDSIDLKNVLAGTSESSLHAVLDLFAQFQKPVYHVMGNHDFYNFSKEFLRNSKLFSGKELYCSEVPNKVYYTAEPHPGLKIVVLDCYDISSIACPEGSPEYTKAMCYLKENPNEDKDEFEGLNEETQMMVASNGALSKDQLTWLEEHLQEAESNKRNVIVLGHCPLYLPSTIPADRCWNHAKVMEVLHKYSQSVVCYFAGHNHQGGVAYDDDGILHLTFPGVLENGRDADFGTVYVHKHRMDIDGHGRVRSRTVPLRYNLE